MNFDLDRGTEMRSIIGLMLRSNGHGGDMKMLAEKSPSLPSAAQLVIRAATNPTVLDANTQGFASVSAAFIESVGTLDAVSFLARAGVAMPLTGPVTFIVAIEGGAEVAEGAAKPTRNFTSSAATIQRAKRAALVVLSMEFSLTPHGMRLAQSELGKAVVRGGNDALAALLSAGAPSIAASGSDAAAVLADLGNATIAAGVGAGARLMLIVSPDTALRLAFMGDAGGQAFDMAPDGTGQVAGVPVYVAPELGGSSPGDALLVDGSRIAIEDGGLQLSVVRHANVALDDAGSGDATHSLWQHNQIGLRIERRIALAYTADTSSAPACLITGGWG
jgi:hypothetical protein